MVWARLCPFLVMPNFSTVWMLRSATEHPVSSSTWTWCYFPSRCSNIVMTGRLPRGSSLGFFDRVPALGSGFFRFWDSPHIIVEVSSCGVSRPFKNLIRSLPTAGSGPPCPWSRRPLLFAAWSPVTHLPPPLALSFHLIPPRWRLSKGPLVTGFLAGC